MDNQETLFIARRDALRELDTARKAYCQSLTGSKTARVAAHKKWVAAAQKAAAACSRYTVR